jgi:hypothetical protein
VTATILNDYPHRTGGHCGSGALRDLMQWNSLGWGGPPSEGLVFTLGGSLDFTYARSTALIPPIYLVGRGGDLELDLPRRLGATVTQHATDDPTQGWQRVRDEIDAGRPVLAWADIAELPYLRVRLRMSRHDIVIIGYDDEQQIAHVVDNDRADVQLVPYDALARARCSTSFPQPTRHTIYDIDWPETLPDLHEAAADAFACSAAAMTSPGRSAIAGPDANQTPTGLAAIAGFVEDLPTWPDVFDEQTLTIALAALPAFIEKAGTGGGLFRRLLAQGCHDLADRLAHPGVQALASTAQRTASAWTNLAAAAASPGTASERARDAARAAQPLVDLEHQLCQRLSECSTQLAAREA